MRLFSLALRNLLRNTRRTALTMAAIAVGLMMTLFVAAFQEGSYEDMIRTSISQLAGHVVVQAPGYQDDQEETLVVTDSGRIADRVMEAVPDAVVVRRIQLAGLLTSPTHSTGVGVVAVDPDTEAQVVDLDEQIVEGTWLTDDDRGILIGRTLADQLDVEIGDRLVYMGQHGTDEMVSRLFRVAGIFRTGSAEMDGFMAYVPLVAGQELLGRSDDPAHRVTVHLDASQTREAHSALQTAFSGDPVEVLDWYGALPEVTALIQVDRASSDVLLGIIGLIVAMGVLNTVLMSTLERTREFGVLLALGMPPRRLAALVLSEGLLLGIGGAMLGTLLGAMVILVFQQVGIDITAMAGGERMDMGDGISMSSVVYPVWAWGRALAFIALAIVFTVLSAAWPAWRVSRLQPVEAMRHV